MWNEKNRNSINNLLYFKILKNSIQKLVNPVIIHYNQVNKYDKIWVFPKRLGQSKLMMHRGFIIIISMNVVSRTIVQTKYILIKRHVVLSWTRSSAVYDMYLYGCVCWVIKWKQQHWFVVGRRRGRNSSFSLQFYIV